MTRIEFVKKYAPLLVKTHKGTGLFPSVAIAQAIVETATPQKNGEYAPGTSKLCEVNNFFGVKDSPKDEWTKKNILVRTWEWLKGKKVVMDDKFRAYDTLEEGFSDRVSFLKSNPRYAKAGVFTATTPEDQIERMKKAGYATATNYVEQIVSIINKYKLKEYDKL